ncbi:hypothetical protein [Halobacterium litoreum]|uniref:Uncharacterized protein n=1 Tax=Halobacterium litoreum TaxID=2039234 RepID=A0ABD5NGB7_9EURY|nr:hypothetical protein [Halobacterium litoreum]UHH12778.1 hypothetical protein LT972_11480 [Halobacterium litoreum]
MPRNLARTLALQLGVTGFGFAVAALFLADGTANAPDALWKTVAVLFVLGLVLAGIGANDE